MMGEPMKNLPDNLARLTEGPINIRLGEQSRDRFRKEMKKYCETVIKSRIEDRVCESEADFFAGAMSVLCIVNELHFGANPDNIMDLTPPMWFIGPMSGRSITDNWGL